MANRRRAKVEEAGTSPTDVNKTNITGTKGTINGNETTRKGMPGRDHHRHPLQPKRERPWEEAVEYQGAMYTKMTYRDGRVEWLAW